MGTTTEIAGAKRNAGDGGAERGMELRKPAMSYWQIWNMSFGFFGIQFGWGLQMANMSAI